VNAKELERERLGWAILVGVLIMVSFAARAAGPTPKNVVYTYSLAAGTFVQFALILGFVLLIARHDIRGLLALRRPSSWQLALLLCVIVIVLVSILGGALEPILHAGREQGLTPTRWRPEREAQFGANFLVIVVVAPVVEELTFRGLGYSVLRPLGRWAAILGVGVAFGLAHGIPAALPVLIVFGAGLAYVRDRTGSVYPGMLVHATYNAAALILSITT
jgi:hypothetical protein